LLAHGHWRSGYFQGQSLKPPVANGRIVFQNGQLVSIYHRDKDGVAFDRYSYGSYSWSPAGWSYGWERRLDVARKAGGASATESTVPQTVFTPRFDGQNLVLDYRNGERRFVFGPDDFTYSENGEGQRKWHRLKPSR
jgi:hypothetical protein